MAFSKSRIVNRADANTTDRPEDNSSPVAVPGRLLRLKDVLRLFPVSRSSWYAGIKNGIYPKPVKLGERTVAWRESEILTLSFAAQ